MRTWERRLIRWEAENERHSSPVREGYEFGLQWLWPFRWAWSLERNVAGDDDSSRVSTNDPAALQGHDPGRPTQSRRASRFGSPRTNQTGPTQVWRAAHTNHFFKGRAILLLCTTGHYCLMPPPVYIACPGCNIVFEPHKFERHWRHAHRALLGSVPDHIQQQFTPVDNSNGAQMALSVPAPESASPAFFDAEDPIPSSFDEEPGPMARVEQFPGAGISHQTCHDLRH